MILRKLESAEYNLCWPAIDNGIILLRHWFSDAGKRGELVLTQQSQLLRTHISERPLKAG
jgi:hypothetical protein